jgi:dimethylargininase
MDPVAQPHKIALVRQPAANLAEGLVTHIERSTVDVAFAGEQWGDYVAELAAEGWSIVEVAALPEHADSVFVEDAMVMFGDVAVITSPGAQSRRGETEGAEAAARELGLRVEHLKLPATLDGGDVLKIGSTVYVGQGLRTNAEGAGQLAEIVRPLGYTVVPVPVTQALHLKTAVTALPDGTVIGYPPLVDNPRLFPKFLAVPEAEGSAVLVLDESTLLMSAAAPETTALLEGLGYRVITTDISEFEKLEGGVTCLSVRIR